MKKFIVLVFTVSKDLLLGMLLLVYGLLMGPLAYLRVSIWPERGWYYLRILLAQGLFARFIRASVEWRMGNFNCALVQLESIVSALENSLSVPERNAAKDTVLQGLYTLLAKLHLCSGQLDSAMLVIVRARKVLQIDRLPALPEIDVATAQLLRAGIAAGKLLDSNLLATLVVRTTKFETHSGERAGSPKSSRASRRAGKVIPFPHCNPR